MQGALTPDAERAITDISSRYGLSQDAVLAMLYAVNSGGERSECALHVCPLSW